jgi:hypothetical protein
MHDRSKGFALLALAVALAGSAGGYVLATQEPHVSLDADGCAGAPTGASVAVVDQTDVWPIVEQERMRTALLDLAARMRKNERLTLHALTARSEDASVPWRGFQRCKPTDPSKVDAVTGNAEIERAILDRQFVQPLKDALPELVRGRTAMQSPILELIDQVMWLPHFHDRQVSRTLALLSDLLQHSAALSHLSGPLQNACVILASPLGERLKGHDWRGVRIILTYLRNPRDAARQGLHHLKVWSELFYQLGAEDVYDGSRLLEKPSSACPDASQPRRTTTRRRSHG